MKIETNQLPPDLAGECLRELCFRFMGAQKYYPQKHLLSEYFKETPKETEAKLRAQFRDFFTLDEDYKWHFYSLENEEYQIDIFWYYDGDCTLIIKADDVAYINSDAKKSHGWTRHFLKS